ncbi:MAG: ankyrin repeat domain-containing protein, partial [Pseudomonadota bacterium]
IIMRKFNILLNFNKQKAAQKEQKAAQKEFVNQVTNDSLTEDSLKDFIKKGANIDLPLDTTKGRTKNGITALHYAAAKGNVEMVQLLLEAGANVNKADKPYRMAPQKYIINFLQSAYNACEDIQELPSDSRGKGTTYTALHHAVKKGNIDMIGELVKKGAYVNEPYNPSGFTALTLAVKGNNIPIVNELLKEGANICSVPFSDFPTTHDLVTDDSIKKIDAAQKELEESSKEILEKKSSKLSLLPKDYDEGKPFFPATEYSPASTKAEDRKTMAKHLTEKYLLKMENAENNEARKKIKAESRTLYNALEPEDQKEVRKARQKYIDHKDRNKSCAAKSSGVESATVSPDSNLLKANQKRGRPTQRSI